MKIAKKDMTQEILKKYLDYDAATGHLTWKFKHCNKVIPGNRAGSVQKRSNHRVLNLFGAVHAEHRLVWLWVYGEFPIHHIDHINHNELDNRIVNLREVTQQKNNMNLSKRSDNKTGVTGVWYNKRNTHKKFVAELQYKGKEVYHRSFLTLDEATVAIIEQRKKYGFHPNHGVTKPL